MSASSTKLSAALSGTACHHYIIQPTAYMRSQPQENSVGVSEARFGQAIRILSEFEDWVKITTLVDQYDGWIKKSAVCAINRAYLEDQTVTIAKVNRCRVHLYGIADTEQGPKLSLPYGVLLEVKTQTSPRWLEVTLPDESTAYIQRGDVVLNPKVISLEEMIELSLQLKDNHIPFTWAGTSTFGFDSSGFVQWLYNQMGVFLPRDSKDQYKSELLVSKSIESLARGDLLFFGESETMIRYVGMSLGNNEFIHSGVGENRPYVRISRLTDPAWDGSERLPFRAGKTLANAPIEKKTD